MSRAAALLLLVGCGGGPSPLVATQHADVDRYREAQALERAGDVDGARALYAAISSVERRSLAALQLARLDGRDPREVVDAYPDEVGADRAVEHLALNDPDPVDWLEAAADRHAAHTVGDNALWWAAQASIRRTGDLARARRLLRQLTQRWPRSPYVDDALWTLGALYRALGEVDRAIAVYVALVRARDEESYFVGSYRSALVDDAALLVAHLHFDQGHFALAEAAYRDVLDRFETSALRDDARWGLANARHARGDDPTAALRALVEADSESRHADAARRWLEGDSSAAQRPDPTRTLAPTLDLRHIGAP